jgi:hypothetical protein
VRGVADEHYQGGSPVLQLSGGVEFGLSRHLYWLAEYKFTHNQQHVSIADGTAATALNSHHLVTGLSVHF